MLTVFLDVEYWQGACALLTLHYKEWEDSETLKTLTGFKSGTSK